MAGYFKRTIITNTWLMKLRNGELINKSNVLEWPRQSPNLNPSKNLQKELKIKVGKCQPKDITELKVICRE